jgi:hypothetical protein
MRRLHSGNRIFEAHTAAARHAASRRACVEPKKEIADDTPLSFVSVNRYCEVYSTSRATTWRRIAAGSLDVRRLGPRTVRIAIPLADDQAVPSRKLTNRVAPVRRRERTAPQKQQTIIRGAP